MKATLFVNAMMMPTNMRRTCGGMFVSAPLGLRNIRL